MVNNNNGIPIEVNEKPFEIVQEVNNEIPSYEEFIKNYEKGDVNYDDLSGSDVGEVKGYGPCLYSNADCTHYTSSGWVQLYLGCPAVECGERARNYSTWVHARCGYPIYISKNLEMQCISCENPSYMLSWRFKCSSNKHKGGYRETNYEIFANALTLIGGRARNRDPRIRDIVKIISDQLWDM